VYSLINGLLFYATLPLIKLVYERSNITAFEIVYGRALVIAVFSFFLCYFQGIYILNVKRSIITPLLLRSIFGCASLTLLYTSLHYLSLTETVLIYFSVLALSQGVVSGFRGESK